MRAKYSPGSEKSRANRNIPRSATITFLLIVGFCAPCFADCPSPIAPPGFPENVREFYEDMCRESDAPLVLASDPSLASRLRLPSGGHRLTEDEIYPDNARRVGFEGTVVVAAAVELDGSVHRAKIVQSSGHRSLDDAEWDFWRQYKFDSPGQIDGKPVRTIILERMKFELKGGPGLPASFSDWAVNNLALRILQPLTTHDANALSQDIDETAKHNITLAKIQERFTRYTHLYGGMSLVYYKGFLGAKKVDGVLQYRLWYLVRSTAEDNGAAVLIVTAIDRPQLPGITDFEFQKSPILLNVR